VHREGERQAPGGIHAPKQRIGNGVSTLLAGIPHIEHGIHAIDPRHGDGTAADQYHHGGYASRGDATNEFFLATRQPQFGAIAEFAFFDAGHDHGDITGARGGHGLRDLRFLRIAHAGVPEQLEPRVAGGFEVFEDNVVRGTGRE
jgi:hypothetical protein